MSTKLWGGRFTKSTNPIVEEFTRSIHYDYKLAEYDLVGSILNTEILKKAGMLTQEEALRISKALKSIIKTVQDGRFKPDPGVEDVHTQILNILKDKIGDLALKLHTARSRNEQVALSTKLYCKIELMKLEIGVAALRVALERKADKNKDLIIPGVTHLQHAQPIYLKDYLMAYVEMLNRDSDRLNHISKNIKMTMGAGALAGTPIDAGTYNIKVAKVLKGVCKFCNLFDIQPTTNSLDTVSDRDFVIEILSVLSITGMHLSRLAEDLIIWSTKEFGFVEIDESFCTGSSLMPQKKNPDALELIRGYAGRLYGNLVSVLVMMKGLPLTYNRDMQLDKEPLFNSVEIVLGALKVFSGLIESLEFNEARIREHLKDEALYATDLVYYLVDKGVAFKTAHNIVGRLVRYSIDNNMLIKNMAEGELKKFSGQFLKKEIIKLFDPEVSVKSKRSVKR